MEPEEYNRTERCIDHILRANQHRPASEEYQTATTAKYMLQEFADQYAAQFVPSLDVVLRFSQSEDEASNFTDTLSPDQWAIILRIDGYRTIGDIGDILGWTDDELRRIVYSLLGIGIVRFG
jgi:hypothetical protein